MKNVVYVLGLLVLHGLVYAHQDIEEDLIELMHLKKKPQNQKPQKSSSQPPSKKSEPQNVQPLNVSVDQQPTSKKRLDYKELYDNFELYKSQDLREKFLIDKEALLKEANDELALFEVLEEEKLSAVKKFGVLATSCALVMCGLWIDNELIYQINNYVKMGVTVLSCAGMTYFGNEANNQRIEWLKQKNDLLKKRHQAIKEWLNKVE